MQILHKEKNIDVALLNDGRVMNDIRKLLAFELLPIIAMGGDNTAEERERWLNRGGNDLLSKPVVVDVLFATIQRFVA